MQKEELILILDFCGQYNQLIARRVRECNVYCEIVRHDISAEEIKNRGAKGVIFTGGPASVYGEDAPKCDPEIFNLGIPVLGWCDDLLCTVVCSRDGYHDDSLLQRRPAYLSGYCFGDG